MRFLRPFDREAGFDTGFRGYHAQILATLESAVLVASTIEQGGCGPDLHYHLSDQVYYLLRGTMTVRLGDEQQQIDAGTLVYIPAGLAHCNWNAGPGAETHIEMLIPAPAVGSLIAIPVDTQSDVPADRQAVRPGWVRAVEPENLTECMPGIRIQLLAAKSMGPETTVVTYAEVAPGRGGPGTHVHDFDEYYLVLEGELTVEVALERHVAQPNTLVVLPAGVPHRQYNDGPATSKHLAILAPAPVPGELWDQGVNFAANGDDHSAGYETISD